MRHTTERHPLSKHKNASPGSAYFTRKPNNNTEKRGSNKNSGGGTKTIDETARVLESREVRGERCERRAGTDRWRPSGRGLRPQVGPLLGGPSAARTAGPREEKQKTENSKNRTDGGHPHDKKQQKRTDVGDTLESKNGKKLDKCRRPNLTDKNGQPLATRPSPPKKIVEMLATHSQKIIGWRPNQNNRCMHV